MSTENLSHKQIFEMSFEGKTPVMSRDDDGTLRWELNGVLHREGGPAVETPGGDFIWARYGDLHRIGAPAYHFDGHIQWFENGQRHREGGGPAEERRDGTKKWWRRDQLHREDGPAVIKPDGREEWWVNGNRLAPEDTAARKAFFAAAQAAKISAPFKGTLRSVIAPEKAAFKKRAGGKHGGQRHERI